MSQWTEYRKQGRCGRCGKTPRPGKGTCARCGKLDAARVRKYHRIMRDRLASFDGLCSKCGEATEGGLSKCEKCLERDRVLARRNYARDPANKDRATARTRQLRKDRRAKGLCAECGAPSPKFFRCLKCRGKRSKT